MTYWLLRETKDDWAAPWTYSGSYDTLDDAKDAAREQTVPGEVRGQTISNRFAIYAPSGDQDKDGLVDSFDFIELVNGTPPPEQKATLRKVKRKK